MSMARVHAESLGDSIVDVDLSEIEENVTHAEDFERRLDAADDDIAFASFTTTLGEMMIHEIGDEFGKKENALLTVQKKRGDMRREMYVIEQLKASVAGQLLEAVKADLARAKASFREEESVEAFEHDDSLALAGVIDPLDETAAVDNIGSSMVVSLLQDLEDTVASTDLHTSRLKGKLAFVSKRCLQAEHVNQRLKRERERLLKALKIATADQQSLERVRTQEQADSSMEVPADRPSRQLDRDISTDMLATKLQKMYREVRSAKQQRRPEVHGSRSTNEHLSGRRMNFGDSRMGRSTDKAGVSDTPAFLEVSDTSEVQTHTDSSSDSTCTLRVQGVKTGPESLSTWDTISTSTIATTDRPNGHGVEASASCGLKLSSTRPKGSRLVWGADGDWRWEEAEPRWHREDAVRHDARNSDLDSDETASSEREELQVEQSRSHIVRSQNSSIAPGVRGDQRSGYQSSSSSVRAGGSKTSVASMSRSQAFQQAMLRRRTQTSER